MNGAVVRPPRQLHALRPVPPCNGHSNVMFWGVFVKGWKWIKYHMSFWPVSFVFAFTGRQSWFCPSNLLFRDGSVNWSRIWKRKTESESFVNKIYLGFPVEVLAENKQRWHCIGEMNWTVAYSEYWNDTRAAGRLALFLVACYFGVMLVYLVPWVCLLWLVALLPPSWVSTTVIRVRKHLHWLPEW